MKKPTKWPAEMRALGIPSFHREDYARAKAVMTDGATFSDFENLERRTKTKLKELRDQGILAERVYLDLDEFLDWCSASEIEPDAQARIIYAGILLNGRHKNQS